MNFDFINYKLNDVWFSGSLFDNVKIKNSTLEKVRFDGVEVYKQTYKNVILITNCTPMNDYTSFLKEIS